MLFLFVENTIAFNQQLYNRQAMGSITTVLAVLEIHMLIKAVANINPKITRLGVVPVL